MQINTDYINKVNEINKGLDLKYYILTMGCQLNENDSEKISGMLNEMNYQETFDMNDADLIIFNTCCVRENAEQRLFGKVGEVKKIKEKKNVILAICGCMMQEKVMVEKIHQSYKYVDIIFGTHTIHQFPEDLYNCLINKEKISDILDIDGEVYEGMPIKRNNRYKASVTIMYGCNNFCAFCIVPYVRGRERSRAPEDIINEIEALAKDGYKEVTLLGQNVNSYRGNDKIKNFADLLEEVCKIEGIERIRFTSPHPKDFTDDVIDVIAKNPKICRIIHMPLQSGNSKVLKEMSRKYTKEQYLALVDKMKARIPDVEFSTDIIVGFPGETEDEFQDTLDVVEKVNFEQIFMFIYSPRIGTVAERREDQVDENTKHERFTRLQKLYESKVEQNNEKYIGKVENVLIEEYSKTNPNMYSARTGTNKIVVFEPKENQKIGDIVKVKIISQHKWFLLRNHPIIFFRQRVAKGDGPFWRKI